MTTPKIAGGHSFLGLMAEGFLNVIQALERKFAPGLTVGASRIGRNTAALESAKTLSLSNSLPTGSPGLSDLPEERPENQAKIPTTISGMRSFVFLSQEMVGDEGLEEQFKLMQG
jgi:hypothetical protein